jgi:hypothetical protein
MTKRILTLVVLLSLLFSAKTIEAHAYRPMIQDSVRWIVIRSDWNNPDRWEYYSLGDTMVDNILYKKIYHRFLEPEYGMLPPYEPVSPYVLFGLMREDTLARQVFGVLLSDTVHFYSACPPGSESLMYDFSLNVGDTLFNSCIVNMYDFISYVVNSISNCNALYGVTTRCFEIGDGMLYEGIGSNYGLWEAMFDPVKTSSDWYTSLEYYCPDADCPYIVGEHEIPIEGKVKTFPNPVRNELTIELSSADLYKPVQIEMLSIQGELLDSFWPMTKTIRLPISGYKPGIYLLRISSEKTQMVYKIVKV